MPGWMGPSLDRKSFLRVSTAMMAGVLVQRIAPRSALAASAATNTFALLSDTHIAADPKTEYRGFQPAVNLQAAIQQIRKTPFDMAMINGDVARSDGQTADYQYIQGLLQPLAEHCPITLGMGNHDDRDRFREVFTPPATEERQASNRHVTLIDSTHARWLVLDSLLYVNKTAGLLGKAQRTWLREFLSKSSDKPTLIMLHHTLGDNDGELLDSRELLEIAKASSHVKAIFYGHSHRYEFKRDGRLHLINLPALGYNFLDTEPVGWVAAQVAPNGIQLKLHAIAGNQSKNGEEVHFEWDA